MLYQVLYYAKRLPCAVYNDDPHWRALMDKCITARLQRTELASLTQATFQSTDSRLTPSTNLLSRNYAIQLLLFGNLLVTVLLS